MDFEKKIIECVNEKLNDGTVERLIEEKLEKGRSEALDSVFGYSGTARNLLKEKIDEVMVPVIERHDFNNYMLKLDSVLTEIVNKTTLEDNKKILENFKHLMKEPDCKEIKVSKIFEAYCKHVAENVNTDDLEACCEDGEPYYSHVTARMDTEHKEKYFASTYDDCKLIFTCEEDEKLDCRIRLYKTKEDKGWRILSDVGSIDINSLQDLSEFEILINKIKRSFAEIEMDEENLEDDDIEPEEKPEWNLG